MPKKSKKEDLKDLQQAKSQQLEEQKAEERQKKEQLARQAVADITKK